MLARASTTSSLTPSILEMTEGDMLRGVRLASVLRCGGQLLADCKGSEDTYSLSQPVAHLDAFISHSWATRRSLKYFVLALHFNTVSATLAALACVAVTAALAVARGGPVLGGKLAGIFGLPLTLPVFFGVMLWRQEFAFPPCCSGPLVFLDKVCIDQQSEETKVRGVSSLAAFLRHSSCLVVCYTDVYLQRLWTVYELATFLQVHVDNPRSRVHVLPIGHCIAMALCSLVVLASAVTVRVVQLNRTVDTAVLYSGVAAGALGTSVILRGWAHQLHKTHSAVSSFSLEDARCAREEDRALVKANSIALMQHYGFVRRDASEEEALAAFNTLVRTAVPDAFIWSLGRIGTPYRLLLPCCLTLFSSQMDYFAASQRVASLRWDQDVLGATASGLITIVLLFTSAFAALPLAYAMILVLSRFCLHLRGVKEAFFKLTTAAAGAATYFVCDPWDGLLDVLLPDFRRSVASRVVLLVWCALLAVATAVLFSPVRSAPLKRRESSLFTTVCVTARAAGPDDENPATPEGKGVQDFSGAYEEFN